MDEQIRGHVDEGRTEQAFDLLMTAYQDKVFRLACGMLGDRGLAEEITQDVFVRIWKSLKTFRGGSSLSTWIYTIARNACLTARRAVATNRMTPLNDLVPDRRKQLAGGDHAIDILRMLQDLPENYREALTLFYVEDKSYDEVARILDIPIGTVRTYLHRGRKQLAAAVIPKMAKGAR